MLPLNQTIQARCAQLSFLLTGFLVWFEVSVNPPSQCLLTRCTRSLAVKDFPSRNSNSLVFLCQRWGCGQEKYIIPEGESADTPGKAEMPLPHWCLYLTARWLPYRFVLLDDFFSLEQHTNCLLQWAPCPTCSGEQWLCFSRFIG